AINAPGSPLGYLSGFGGAMQAPGLKDFGLEVWSRTNPLVKALVELPTGTSTFQRGPRGGRALEELDPTLGRTLSNVAGLESPVGTPNWLEYAFSASPLSRALTSARTLSDSFGARKDAGKKAAVNLLTGARVTDVSPAQVDAMLREELAKSMKASGAKSFEKVYFRPEEKARMTPRERIEAERFEAMQKILSKRAKARKAKREKQGAGR
ncbi:MAG: hypothetical protein L0Z53_00260, partial [Acidobacteriales bacterium]|nr:hypothetical protein [Terriglobales bacterium]